MGTRISSIYLFFDVLFCRISTLEMLDEIEELELVLEHYGITWGLKTFGSIKRPDWLDWGLKRAPAVIEI